VLKVKEILNQVPRCEAALAGTAFGIKIFTIAPLWILCATQMFSYPAFYNYHPPADAQWFHLVISHSVPSIMAQNSHIGEFEKPPVLVRSSIATSGHPHTLLSKTRRSGSYRHESEHVVAVHPLLVICGCGAGASIT
jgi:hypothetical protein